MIIEKICVAKIFWNEIQQRWLKSVTCAIQFIFAVKCAMQTNCHFTLEKHERNIKANLPEFVPAWQKFWQKYFCWQKFWQKIFSVTNFLAKTFIADIFWLLLATMKLF